MVRTSQATAAESLKVFPPVETTQGTNTEVADDLAVKNRLSSSETGSFIIMTSPSVKAKKPGLNLLRKDSQKSEQQQKKTLKHGRKTQIQNQGKHSKNPAMVVQMVAVDGISLSYLIIVADAADAVSVNFSGRCKFLHI